MASAPHPQTQPILKLDDAIPARRRDFPVKSRLPAKFGCNEFGGLSRAVARRAALHPCQCNMADPDAPRSWRLDPAGGPVDAINADPETVVTSRPVAPGAKERRATLPVTAANPGAFPG